MEGGNFEVKCKGERYEISDFLKNHPGGTNYVQGFRNKDIGEQLVNEHHSKAAWYLLREYRLNKQRNLEKKDDGDLEYLVDWTKPMLGQVGNLGKNYNEWVLFPVDRTLTLFENKILEYLSLTPWYFVPIFWIPVITYFTYKGSFTKFEPTSDLTDLSEIFPKVIGFSLGIVNWTLLEYSLHRWIFHMKLSGRSKLLIRIHFTIHGLHHKVPFDRNRLVFPPFPAAIIACTLYQMYAVFIPDSIIELFFAGNLLAYVLYDMIHYYLHSGCPKEGTYFYNMKRYHNQHHFVHHKNAFGISSFYWDVIFGTLINLRKLRFGIRWSNITTN